LSAEQHRRLRVRNWQAVISAFSLLSRHAQQTQTASGTPAIATCKKQNRNFFSFLEKSTTAQLQDRKPPSFLYA
jgi:hypothetical protein